MAVARVDKLIVGAAAICPVAVVALVVALGFATPETDPGPPAPTPETEAGKRLSAIINSKAPPVRFKPGTGKPAVEVSDGAISAESLYSSYESNEVAADLSFKGRSIRVSGGIQRIGKDILGSPYLAIRSGDMKDFQSVQGVFSERDEVRLAMLRPGQSVVIECIVSGKMLDVILTQCQLVNP